MTRYKVQILVIALALGLLGGLFFFPNKPEHKIETIPVQTNGAGVVSYVDIISSEKEQMNSKDVVLSTSIQAFEKKIASAISEKEKMIFSDSLSRLSLAKSPLLAAHYNYQKAQLSKNTTDWTRAGDFYMLAVESVNDNSRQAVLGKAVESFENALLADSSNADVQVRLAVAYVEDGNNPMKGIMLLRGVAEKHPDNIAAQFNLGLFSIKSGQYDKAIARFNKVLEIDSTYHQAWFYLGQCELELGHKQKAIEKFKYYEYLCTDSIEKKNIKQYINKLLTT